MEKQTRQYIAATKAWIKTQKISIESCDLAINQSRQQIALHERAIKSETQERILKVNQLKEVQRQLSTYTRKP